MPAHADGSAAIQALAHECYALRQVPRGGGNPPPKKKSVQSPIAQAALIGQTDHCVGVLGHSRYFAEKLLKTSTRKCPDVRGKVCLGQFSSIATRPRPKCFAPDPDSQESSR